MKKPQPAKPRARAKAPPARAKTARPKYEILEFPPMSKAEQGVNIGLELLRIGRAVGGVHLELPPRGKIKS
ncbi:MAG: hypothetical protein ACR2P5_02720 [Gammaproteobacteria bacterium]